MSIKSVGGVFGRNPTFNDVEIEGDLNVESTSSLNGAVVINESGADVDFRIESDTDANAFFLDGATGNIGIGTDTASTLLDVDGTANATNLTRGGSQVYSRDNILGTVTESSGVPTGAIIESGSNANGEFVKYADGTMICFRTRASSSSSFAAVTITFAATFSTIYYANGMENGTGSGTNNGSGQYLSIRSSAPLPINNSAVVTFNLQSGYQTRLVSTAYDFTFIAIGRWF